MSKFEAHGQLARIVGALDEAAVLVARSGDDRPSGGAAGSSDLARLRLAVQSAHRRALALMIDLHTTGGAVPRDPTVPAPSFPVADAGLTKREREVATLIADGLSNRGIATLLSTSQRTAESHVEHILRKLGFTSRVQVAAWIAAACGSGLEPMPHC